MAKPKAKSKSHLPTRAPKRTGKRDVRPLDAAEDFETPVKKEPETETKKPRQARLPQMDDPQIEELESAAEDYAAIRDERMALTPREKKLKDDLLAAMKRHNKEKYVRDGIEIRIVHETETVKVKVKHTEED